LINSFPADISNMRDMTLFYARKAMAAINI
jgi:hypothetical protein